MDLRPFLSEMIATLKLERFNSLFQVKEKHLEKYSKPIF